MPTVMTSEHYSELNSTTSHTDSGPLRSVVFGFDAHHESARSLPLVEQIKLTLVADFIADSYQPGARPIRTVQIIGHADQDTRRGHKFEYEISQKRAWQVEQELRKAVDKRTWAVQVLIAPKKTGLPDPAKISWNSVGVGATIAAEQNVIRRKTHLNMSENDRKLNRRVEVILHPGPQLYPQPASPQIRIRMTLGEVLRLLRRNHGKAKLPPWFWDPAIRPRLNTPDWVKFRKLFKEKLENLDLGLVISTLQEIMKGNPQNNDLKDTLREILHELVELRQQGPMNWWEDPEDEFLGHFDKNNSIKRRIRRNQ